MFCQLFSLQNKSFLCLQHVENKGFQTVIKHRLKAIQKPIKNELGNRKKKHKKCTFRFEKMHISFSRLYKQERNRYNVMFSGANKYTDDYKSTDINPEQISIILENFRNNKVNR